MIWLKTPSTRKVIPPDNGIWTIETRTQSKLVNEQSPKMGKTNSKSDVVHNADPQIRIVNNQEIHSEFHEEHAIKLNIVLVVVSAQLILVVYKMWRRRVQQKAIRKIKSIAELDKV